MSLRVGRNVPRFAAKRLLSPICRPAGRIAHCARATASHCCLSARFR